MGYRYDDFVPGEIYHVFTRSVEKRRIFLSDKDRLRFLELLVYSIPSGQRLSYSLAKRRKFELHNSSESAGLVNLLCYCLMDNHVHLLLRENTEKGISRYVQRLLNAYAKYFNTKEKRSGSLFLHPFKAVRVDGDDHFLHVTRYIHLNPYVAHMTEDPCMYPWSSISQYVYPKGNNMCYTTLLNSLMDKNEYKQFILDEADYARSLADIEHLLIDYDE